MSNLHKFLTVLFIIFIFSFGTKAQQNNVLLEFCTGTWCKWCPCGDAIAESILSTYPNTMILAYHGGGGGDPFQTFNGSEIMGAQYHNFVLYPSGAIGRRTGSATDRADWASNVTSQQTNAPGVSITVNKTYNPTTRVLTADIQS